MTKVAIVIQRYGTEIIGGAETHCRHVAERLVKELNWDITVYTTEALDYMTWKNELNRPEETIGGVKVKRFRVPFPRYPKIFNTFHRIATPIILKLAAGKLAARFLGRILERVWFVLQGPYCPSLVRALREDADQYDKIFFFTYLYYPTIYGAKALRGRHFSLIPTAHREPAFYFQHIRKLLLSTQRILANINPEKDLIESRLAMPMPMIKVVGLGFDIPQTLDIRHTPDYRYILYLGRICVAKGARFLIEAFQHYLQQNPASDLRLVLVGKKDEDFSFPDDPRIQYLGFVDDTRKFSLIGHSVCVVNPSPYESLSMIAIEAMVCRKPLLLNRHSEVLNYYCQIHDTCYGYGDRQEFISQLTRIDGHDWGSPASIGNLEAARTWAEQSYSWEAVTQAYAESPDQFPRTGRSDLVATLKTT